MDGILRVRAEAGEWDIPGKQTAEKKSWECKKPLHVFGKWWGAGLAG